MARRDENPDTQLPRRRRQVTRATTSADLITRQRRASRFVMSGFIAVFAALGGQLLALGWPSPVTISLAAAEVVAVTHSRPDIVDRNGRLLATDLRVPSLYADPAIVIDRDEVVEKLLRVLPDLNAEELRASLYDRSRRFVWVRRGLSPLTAQHIHDLGLPGLEFRYELKRAYPHGRTAGHVLGGTDVDNRGLSGIEAYVDRKIGIEAVSGATLSNKPPVRLSLDVGVQHALEDELANAVRDYAAKGAAGVVLDIRTGEVLASASLPDVDPANPVSRRGADKLDKLMSATFELGSVFKAETIALAMDEGLVSPSTVLDVTRPLQIGRYTIRDPHPAGRPLSVTEIFLKSSNVGAGMLALKAGAQRTRRFYQSLGLLGPIETEAGTTAAPQLPPRFGDAELVTMSYGHGLAVAPLQFASATAALLNGGKRMQPTLLRVSSTPEPVVRGIVTDTTGQRLGQMFRLNVMSDKGTGKRADAVGFRVGGKTGTAELARGGGYSENAVVSSFVAAFPMDAPAYLTFVMVVEPKGQGSKVGSDEGGRSASKTAAPLTGRLIARIAPQLGVKPVLQQATN